MTKPDEDYGIPRRWITLFFVALTVAFIILAFVIGLKERRDAGLLALCALGSSAVLIISPWVPKPAKLKVSPTGEIEVNLAQQVQQANATAEEAKETASKATQQVQQANATAEEAKETASKATQQVQQANATAEEAKETASKATQQVQQANATAEEAKETASKATQQVQQANATAEEAKETASKATQQVQQANATAEEAKETASKATQQVQQANATAEEAKETATDALDTITRLVRNSMREETFENLKKIASGKFGHFKMTFNFQQQLRHLQEAGCIATWKGHIAQIPKEGSDLSEYVYCTKPGHEFIQERLDAEARENSPLAS